MNSEGFRETFLRKGRKTQGAKMAGREEAAERAEGPRYLGSEIGGRKTESYLEKTGDLAPVYQGEGVQGREGLSRSERHMEFVRETMLTTPMLTTPPDILLKRCGLFSKCLLIIYLMKLSNSF